ncbi:MAG: flagellar basal body M-ring protein FliF [Clostridium sp.]|nr:flagellar basal body M-ring protein FliF [Clostridium sp.]
MNKFLDMFKGLGDKFKACSKKVKIAIIAAIVAILVAIVSVIFFATSTKYAVLFSNLDSADANAIKSKLEEKKISMKVEGNSILVPEENVDELRLELASELSSSSKGYELMDGSNSFGMTDEEFAIKKVRMVQGELEKSIKSLDAVESARVHINAATNSVFVKDAKAGSAAVILKLKPGTKIDESQVKSIVSMVSAGTENIPKEKVEVMDTEMNLLTEGLSFDSDSNSKGVSSATVAEKKSLEEADGAKYSKAIVDLLEPVLGKKKVSANVNVDLDFDSKQKTVKTIDPNKVIVSQQTSKETNGSGSATTNTESPVDNNMSATISTGNNNNNGYVKEDQTTNYESGSTETTTISSPGEIKRMTASIFVDGDVDEATRSQLEQSVAAAIGIDTSRGDSISLVGMEFDTSAAEETQKQIDSFNEELANAKKNKLIMYGIIGAAALIAVIIIIVLVKRRKEDEEEEEERLLDVVVNDQGIKDDTMQYAPIEFEVPNEQVHLENEIKDYAKQKPDQVADIIKSWLSENER